MLPAAYTGVDILHDQTDILGCFIVGYKWDVLTKDSLLEELDI